MRRVEKIYMAGKNAGFKTEGFRNNYQNCEL